MFDDNLEAKKTAVAIKELKRELDFSEGVEFKFNKSRKFVREEFLFAVNPFCFKVRCIVIEKKIIRSDELRSNKKSLNNVLIQMADMVAGAIRRSYCEDKTDKNIYKSIIKKHITSEWKFK